MKNRNSGLLLKLTVSKTKYQGDYLGLSFGKGMA